MKDNNPTRHAQYAWNRASQLPPPPQTAKAGILYARDAVIDLDSPA
jgi:hypothetical protein